MTKEMFESMAEELKTAIVNDIAYTYAVFIPQDTKRVISKMKRNILMSDRKFLDQDLRNSIGNRLIFPCDVLIPKLKKHISDFYEEFNLSSKTLERLSHYDDRSEVFKKQFKDNLEKSKDATAEAILHEINLQMMQSKDAKQVIANMQKVLSKRMTSLKRLLKQSAGQMEQYMILWDYQDKGYTHYRLRTNGDNCKDCTALNGEIFPIYKAESGVNFALFHPNCDCTAEILDEKGNTVFVIGEESKEEESSKGLDYLQTSIKQVLLGNYTDDSNLLGTLGQLALGLLGLDAFADIRDLAYDVTNWEDTRQHKFQTILDAAAILPIVGGVKYIDEAGDALKAAAKHGDEAAEATTKAINKLPWDSWQTYEKVNQNGQTYAKIGNRLYSEHAVNRMQPSGNRFGPNIYQGLKGKDYGRSIAPQYIEDVINSTKAVFQPETGNFVHTMGTVKVIVNPQGAVVTVITYQ